MAYAQAVPSSADAGRITVDEPKYKLSKPSGSAPISQEEGAQPALVAVPEGADKVFLTLRAIKLEGNTRFTEEELREIYADKLGTRIPLTEIYMISAKITQYYRKNGYVLTTTTIPPQEMEKDATVRIQVVEGSIREIQIAGEIPAETREKILAYAERLKEETPISSTLIERQLLLINDLPGVFAKSTLYPLKGTTGGVGVKLDVVYKPYSARAGLDTLGNTYIGPERMRAVGQLNEVPGGVVDSVLLSGQAAASIGELKNIGISLNKNIGTDGLRAELTANYTDSNPSIPGIVGSVLKPNGKAAQLSAALEYPIIRARTLNWSVRSSFDYIENRTDFAPGFEALETRDHVRALRASTRLRGADSWNGFNYLFLEASRGLDVLGSSQMGDKALSRLEGDPLFTKFIANTARFQSLGKHFNLLFEAEGQWSDDALLTVEEYGIGGYRFGRGFDSSEITGDKGLAAKLELIYNADYHNAYMNNLRYFTFYDVGRTWDTDPSVGVEPIRSISSAGVGVRFNAMERLSSEFYIAKPLTGRIASRAFDKQDEWRVLMNLSIDY